jgi:ubiquinone/menaquinone biosynthesis C-methylase UbiE
MVSSGTYHVLPCSYLKRPSKVHENFNKIYEWMDDARIHLYAKSKDETKKIYKEKQKRENQDTIDACCGYR